MELINRLPFPAMAFRQFDNDGKLDCVVAVRGTFLHNQGQPLEIMREQEEFQWEDAYDGDPHKGVLLRQTDLTPEKSGTDVTFLGNAYAPEGRPSTNWTVSLRVGHLEKKLRVYGERFWKPVVRDAWAGFSAKKPKRVLKDWRLSETTPVSVLPMTWSKAYGGEVPGTGDPDADIPADVEVYNPLGCGIVNLDMEPGSAPVRAPQIMIDNDEQLDWRAAAKPEGFGPISPWWRFRQKHSGTYDEHWLNERHPLLPDDFDPLFWQCAHPDLIATPHLLGDEDYRLENLHADLSWATGQLPGLTFGVHCMREDIGEWHVLKLDGVHFDWRSDDRVLLTWRVRFPLPEAADARLTLTRVKLGGVSSNAQAEVLA
ncbi:hypothetical protein FBZ98_107138 [Rhizobium sp. ERR 922]|uniref:DUF2169 family type VI secretion system accessory protein n=1 Tax=unclassified Rhizobium TaxID=2613769 RepID=UPI0011AA35C6|nr:MULTISPECIES: DUF2169 domain-containing protein [unclassified Rhizobium]TWB49105.1 hypothetical protein FBZ98_107138 [Rhizobium sp. ERR 922]TWB91637.1 hypothetical protein FBZ97_107138 [Rhizobium sp. ERR 942]